MNYFFSILYILTSFTSCDNNSKKNDRSENLTASDSSGLIMDEDVFWALIDKSIIASNNDYQKQITSLKKILVTLEPNEIEKFDNTFTALLAGSYDQKLWGAAYVINGGCSDDCFNYFRQYLIGHGKDKFYQTYKDPDYCVNWIKTEEEDNWEGLQYSAMYAYKERTGKEIPRTYKTQFVLKGFPFEEKTLAKKYPRLAEKFMNEQ